jgi:hypothetical protein
MSMASCPSATKGKITLLLVFEHALRSRGPFTDAAEYRSFSSFRCYSLFSSCHVAVHVNQDKARGLQP